jgi:K319-like protein
VLRAKCWLLAWFSLTALFGCGGDTSVALCIGSAPFCSQAFNPVAKTGPDQTVASGSLVTLDGSDSEGNVDSYSWAQTGGPAVALRNASGAVATFIAPSVTSAVTLSFRLTVVNETNQADTDSTSVIVQP